MAIVRTEGHWFGASGNGYHTIDVNIAPASVYATVCLHGNTGDGTSYTGIKRFRKRLASGEDEVHDFGEWPSWPPSVFDNSISSITFAIATGSDQAAYLYARMDFWQ
jgi:hypothetical protein